MNRHKQFLKVPYGFIDHTIKELEDDTTLRVWLILRSHYNPKTDRCDPTQEEIASKSGRSIRSVQRAIKYLEARDFLSIDRSVCVDKSGKKIVRNNYILNYSRSRDMTTPKIP